MKNLTEIKKNWSLLTLTLFFVITFSFIIIKGDDMYIQPHDFLDDRFIWLKILKDNQLFFTNGNAPMLHGIDRNYLYPDVKLYSVFYMILPAFWAIIIIWYVRIALSIAGFLLIWATLYQRIMDYNFPIIIGLIYGILPVFPPASIGFATLPFLFIALYKLYHEPKPQYLFFFFLYPIFSDFSFFGIFICIYISIFIVGYLIVRRELIIRFVLAILLLSIGYVITEWRLFYITLFSKEPSIRESFIPEYFDFTVAIRNFFDVLIKGQYHSASQHTLIILPVCVVYLIHINYNYIKNKTFKRIFHDQFNIIFALILFNSAMYVIDYTKWFDNLLGLLIPPLKEMQFSRMLWFNAFLWYLFFLMILSRINLKNVTKYILCNLSLISVLAIPAMYNHICYNAVFTIQDATGLALYDGFSYNEFFSPELFEKIKREINYNGEWSVAFGFNPAVLEYNEIATIDGYLSYYPLSYKNIFRTLIAPELLINDEARVAFDSWGGRAYIFSRDIPYNSLHLSDTQTVYMNIDPNVFSSMGGKYVFSRAKIENADNINLSEIGIYSIESSPYVIYVYERNVISNEKKLP
ncbi:MAG: hypothetical protein IJ608_04125 [Lachnospiraceae bacterium]|nr:hypothetical protein [Lachnospiraceae bacterium]